MSIDVFRQFFDYHFAENRKIWNDFIVPLTFEQFTREVGYSHGSVRKQIIHLMSVDEVWFAELQGAEPSEYLSPTGFDDRQLIRAYWDTVEHVMCGYLTELQDEALMTKPIIDPDKDKDLTVWQVLLHVANHGTDHRAQILRALHDLGFKTTSQDFIFHVYENN